MPETFQSLFDDDSERSDADADDLMKFTRDQESFLLGVAAANIINDYVVKGHSKFCDILEYKMSGVLGPFYIGLRNRLCEGI